MPNTPPTVSNEQAAAYSSVAGFAYSLNAIWSPLVELFKTKKFFVVFTRGRPSFRAAEDAITLGKEG